MDGRAFEFGKVRATLLNPSEDTLRDQARYLLRLVMALGSMGHLNMGEARQFAGILAHVRDTVNFPFDIPDPLSEISAIIAAWEGYQHADSAIVDALLEALDLPIGADVQATLRTYLAQAAAELNQADKSKRGKRRGG